MESHSRFERRSLRDVLVDQGVLSDELADELMNSAREANEVFGAVVVDAGHMTAWDLAKTVSLHYSMPHIPLAGFRYDTSLAEHIPAATLHQFRHPGVLVRMDQVLAQGQLEGGWLSILYRRLPSGLLFMLRAVLTPHHVTKLVLQRRHRQIQVLSRGLYQPGLLDGVGTAQDRLQHITRRTHDAHVR